MSKILTIVYLTILTTITTFAIEAYLLTILDFKLYGFFAVLASFMLHLPAFIMYWKIYK